MRTIAISELVEIRYPDNWDVYRTEALADKKRYARRVCDSGKLYEKRELVSDCHGTLSGTKGETEFLIPGAEALLRSFKEVLGFAKIIVSSSSDEVLDFIGRSIQDKQLVDHYIVRKDLMKANYAAELGVPFVLDDTSDAALARKFLIKPETRTRSHVWVVNVPYLHHFGDEYSPELISDIDQAVLQVCEELEKL